MNPYLDKFLTGLLTPISWIYGGVVWTRNKLYDSGVLKENRFEIPVVSVGNLTVGGTGKTPHVEYIVKHLSHKYNIAVLSRGYKRKTKGFVVLNSRSTPELVGDEPMQIYLKFGERIAVAVCEDRKKGIEKLIKTFPSINLIVLDDAFQHRSIKPKCSILLVDYNRMIEKDKLLPLGRLREPSYAKYRADMVVVTKCPEKIQPIDIRMIDKDLDLLSFQKLFFSSFDYGEVKPVFPENSPYSVHLSSLYEEDMVLLVTGIAYPRMFVRHFRRYPFDVRILRFPDHHDFSRRDINAISDYFDKMEGRRKIILTTEKDAVRLLYNPYFPESLKPLTYYLPIEVVMREGLTGSEFIEDISASIESRTTEE